MIAMIYIGAAIIYPITGLVVNGILHRVYSLSYTELLVHPIFVVLGGMFSIFIAYSTVEGANQKKK